MSANPIHKRTAGWALLANGSSRPLRLRRFGATCPDCEAEVTQGGAYGGGIATRKQAKDALYRHRSKGGIFGCPKFSPALVGE